MRENEPDSLPFDSPEQENARLKDENRRLRRLLEVHGITIPQLAVPEQTQATVGFPETSLDRKERARKRIALFRSLFRGREDVYARRWERGENSGYSPAAAKDWKAIHRSRPEDRKRIERETRRFFPLTDAVIEGHLLGEETIGIYPLLPDENCWFLAADFDKKTWEYDSLAFVESCQELEVPAYRERSRSGKGGHIWIFFDRALPAITARKLGCAITATPTRKDGHHPIIYMQCGPVRFGMSARTMTESTPFEHRVIPRLTDFRLTSDPAQVGIQEIYAALVADRVRNEMIAQDVIGTVESGRCQLC